MSIYEFLRPNDQETSVTQVLQQLLEPKSIEMKTNLPSALDMARLKVLEKLVRSFFDAYREEWNKLYPDRKEPTDKDEANFCADIIGWFIDWYSLYAVSQDGKRADQIVDALKSLLPIRRDLREYAGLPPLPPK